MSEPQITIASAVVVPGRSSPPPPSPTSYRKRRDSRDRPRPDRRDSRDDDGGDPHDRKRARLSVSETADDRNRGRRLFGSVLGNLGKTSDSARARKRMEVEAKMAEKLKQQEAEVREDERRKGRERMEERKEFQERVAKIRISNERNMAHFLCTKAKPRLYYLPWKLLPSQELLIEEQLSKHGPAEDGSDDGDDGPDPTTKPDEQKTDSKQGNVEMGGGGRGRGKEPIPADDADSSRSDGGSKQERADEKKEEAVPQVRAESPSEETKVHMGHDGDEVIEY